MTIRNTITVQHFLRLLLLLVAAPLCAALMPQDAKANVACSMTNSGLAFGTSVSGTGSINYSCTNDSATATSFTLCVALGTPSSPGTATQPMLRLGTSTVNYNVYRDAALTQIWTNVLPLTKAVSVPGGIGSTVTGSFQFYGGIASGQTPTPGNYQASFFTTKLGSISGRSTNCRSSHAGFTGVDFTLPITATIANSCTIDALANADLGTVMAGATTPSGSTAIMVRCSNGTTYNIGVLPSNGNTSGLGQMSGTGANTDRVVYQLRQGSSAGPIWGNTATSSNVGNGVAGTGTGSDQNLTVYVTVPSSSYRPDTYRDTVRITVNY